MKSNLDDKEIREIFTNPHSLKNGAELWKEAEKRGLRLIRDIIEQRKSELIRR